MKRAMTEEKKPTQPSLAPVPAALQKSGISALRHELGDLGGAAPPQAGGGDALVALAGERLAWAFAIALISRIFMAGAPSAAGERPPLCAVRNS